MADASGRLSETFGYDEFGQGLYGHGKGDGCESIQPFGYTGYQQDKIAGTYFAQAREYLPEMGRFAERDKIKGFAVVPMTLNEYGYCWNTPFSLIDLNGKIPVTPDATVYSMLIIMKKIEAYVEEAQEWYNGQREDVPAPVMPTDTTGLPDYTEVIDEWLIDKQQEFQNIRSLGIQGPPVAPINEVALMYHFYNQVKPGGEMDIKLPNMWEEAFGFAIPEHFIYHGEVMDPATLGNITYGYAGSSIYPDFMLYYGAGVANTMADKVIKYAPAVFFLPNYGDAPEDVAAIKKGIEMWNQGLDYCERGEKE